MTKNANQNYGGLRSLSVPQFDQSVNDALNQLLSSCFGIAFRAQLYRWNVTGPLAFTLSAKFGREVKRSANAADAIGSRIRLLNPNAPVHFGSEHQLRKVTQENRIPERWDEMVTELINAHQQAIEPCRYALQAAQTANDNGTVYLCMKQVKAHEKAILRLGNLIAEHMHALSPELQNQ